MPLFSAFSSADIRRCVLRHAHAGALLIRLCRHATLLVILMPRKRGAMRLFATMSARMAMRDSCAMPLLIDKRTLLRRARHDIRYVIIDYAIFS